jgi:hypothetical protein
MGFTPRYRPLLQDLVRPVGQIGTAGYVGLQVNMHT